MEMPNPIVNLIVGYAVKLLPTHSNAQQSKQNRELVELTKEEYRRNQLHRNRQRRKSEENLYAMSFATLSCGIIYLLLTAFVSLSLITPILVISAGGSFLYAKLDYAIATDKLYPIEK